MRANENSRLVWSDERGGAVGDKPSKNLRHKQKHKKTAPAAQSGGGFPKAGIIRVCREKSGRGGKTVTVLYGVPGSQDERNQLLKSLKQLCGCGGALKGSFLEIQGDQREKILAFLQEQGHKVKAAGG
ncbi:MAG: translation initiation factor [Kiritimatiellia bacterium]